jgi:hypothetical protein
MLPAAALGVIWAAAGAAALFPGRETRRADGFLLLAVAFSALPLMDRNFPHEKIHEREAGERFLALEGPGREMLTVRTQVGYYARARWRSLREEQTGAIFAEMAARPGAGPFFVALTFRDVEAHLRREGPFLRMDDAPQFRLVEVLRTPSLRDPKRKGIAIYRAERR